MANKLAQFEVIVKMKELEIHVRGDRQVGPEIADNVGQHISGVIQTAGLLQAPQSNGHNGQQPQVIDAPEATRRRRKAARKGAAVVLGGDGAAAAPLTWNHDAAKWGTPVQSWKSYQKCAWLLRVLEQAGAEARLTTVQLADTFNDRFASAGKLLQGNLARDMKNHGDWFGELDGRWFLKDIGKGKADELIAQAKGSPVSPTGA